MSRLLKLLTDELARGGGVREQLLAKSRLAIHLSRRGEFDAATRVIGEIRALGAAGLLTESTARANLAEGVLAFCTGSTEGAIDKLRRARALSDAGHLPQASRWACAWLAHMELNLGHTAEVQPYAARLVVETPTDEHWVLSRIGSTLAAGLHFANRFDLARPWYEFARQHAVAEGDDLTIDANLHNVAAFRSNNLRLSEISGRVDIAELRRAEQEFNSSLNYDAMKASQSFRWMIPLIDAQLDLLAGRNGDATAKYLTWISNYQATAPRRLLALSAADYSVCLATQGARPEADAQMQFALGSVPSDMAIDEMALLKFRQFQLAALQSDSESATRFQVDAEAFAAAHAKAQLEVANTLAAIHCPAITVS